MSPRGSHHTDSSSSSSSSSSDSDDSSSGNSSSGSSRSSGSQSGESKHSNSSADDDQRQLDVGHEETSVDSQVAQHHTSHQHRLSDSLDGSESDHLSRKDSIRAIIQKCGPTASLKKLAAQQPDLYGIRRSVRQRKEVDRFNAGNESDSDDKPQRRGRSGPGKGASGSWEEGASGSSDGEVSEDYHPASTAVRKRPTRTQRNQRSKARPSGQRPATMSRRKRLSETTSGSGSSSSSEQSSSEETSDDDRRTSSRRNNTVKKVSYKEESEGVTDSDEVIEVDTVAVPEKNDAETIEKVIKRRMGKKGATGSRTTVYNVTESGDPNNDPEKQEIEVQFLIKWKGWSHMHNTWESEITLREQKVNGLKKLDNFIKKDDELEEWKQLANPEDIEFYLCQQELMDDLYVHYCKVERIIIHTASKHDPLSTFPDYLVKWQGLPYSDATYEDGQLVKAHFPKALEEYHQRQKSQSIPTKYCKVLKHRPKFVKMKTQPDYIGDTEKGLELRDYQLDGLNWLLNSWCRNNSVILADEMGLGKTIQTISFLTALMNVHHCYGPFLIVVPLSTIVTWQREFHTWSPDVNVVVYIGDMASRNIIREREWCHPGNKRLKFNVLITTYEILLKDKSFLGGVQWACLAVDEAHRLKNDDSLLYKSLITFDTNHRLLITGTPLQNSLKELWSLLHFIMPEKFMYWDEFERRHKSSDKTGFRALHQELEPYLLRRVKKDVEKSLPSKTEQILRVEMTNLQKQYYKWILTKNYRALSKGGRSNVSSFINIVMELKKCCNHAFLVKNANPNDPSTVGKDPFEVLVKSSGKLILLDKLLMRLRESGHRVLIFSQMVRLLDILAEYLQLRRFPYQRLDGSIRGEVRKQAMDHFNAEGSNDFCFLLSTKAGGLGVNLATADTVIIFDSDWNPQNDLQAQARAHRIGQKKQVSVYRLVTKGSVEEDIVERAKKKMVLDHLVIQRMDTTGRTVLSRGGQQNGGNPFNKDELNAILKFGVEELFKEGEDEEQDLQVDIDDILSRAETRNVDNDTDSATNELLSQFKVVSFDNLEEEELEGRDTQEEGRSWDDIIPEVDRKKVEEAEIQQQLLELNLPPRSRKQVKPLNMIGDSGDEDVKASARRRRGKGEDDDSDLSDEDSDDEPKRRGRPRVNKKDGVKGFTGAEVRRFIKSYKKFGRPKERLDDIAGDAELQEKSQVELERLADVLHTQCEAAMHEYEQKLQEETQPSDGKKSGRGPSFKLSGVTVNAKNVLQAAIDLEPLVSIMPSDLQQRNQFQLAYHVKTAHFDCEWEEGEDGNLLRGVYQYGLDNWEAIKMDPDLNLQDKILPDGELKPQGKHLHTRVDYLLKVIAKHTGVVEKKEAKVKGPKVKANKARVHNNPRVKSREIIDDGMDTDSDSDGNKGRDNKENRDNSTKSDVPAAATAAPKRKKRAKEESKKDAVVKAGDVEMEEAPKESKKAKKKKKEKSQGGPCHFTTHETVAVDILGMAITELPKEAFSKCKDMMRPVKKSLRQLGNPDQDLSEKEQFNHTRRCLLKIGDHITESLHKFNDPEVIKEWRSHLWVFVSKFTEFDAKRLHKVYKNAVKKREEDQEKGGKGSRGKKLSSSSRHKESGANKRPSEDDGGHERSSKKMKSSTIDTQSDSSRDTNLVNGPVRHGGSQYHRGDAPPSHGNDHDKSRSRFSGSSSAYDRPPGGGGASNMYQKDRPFKHKDQSRYNSDRSFNRTDHFHDHHRGDYRGDHYNRDRRDDHGSGSHGSSGYSGYRGRDDRQGDRFYRGDRKRGPGEESRRWDRGERDYPRSSSNKESRSYNNSSSSGLHHSASMPLTSTAGMPPRSSATTHSFTSSYPPPPPLMGGGGGVSDLLSQHPTPPQQQQPTIPVIAESSLSPPNITSPPSSSTASIISHRPFAGFTLDPRRQPPTSHHS